MKFKIIPDEETSNTQTILLKTDGGASGALSSLDGIIGTWVSEQLRKSLEKKDDKKDDDKDKKKAKTYTKAEVMCWSLLLMCTAPWSGLWILSALDNAKIHWAKILLSSIPK